MQKDWVPPGWCFHKSLVSDGPRGRARSVVISPNYPPAPIWAAIMAGWGVQAAQACSRKVSHVLWENVVKAQYVCLGYRLAGLTRRA